VVIAMGNNVLWKKFCEHVNQRELINDSRFCTNALRTENHEELFPILAEIMRQRSTEQWETALEEIGVPCGPVNTVDKVASDPQVLAREMIVEVEHQMTGAVGIPGVPIKLSETPGSVDAPAPNLGEHTDEVLTGLLGMAPDEVDRLKRQGVV